MREIACRRRNATTRSREPRNGESWRCLLEGDETTRDNFENTRVLLLQVLAVDFLSFLAVPRGFH